MLHFDLSSVYPFAGAALLEGMAPRLAAAHELLASGAGPGGAFTGWLRLPRDYDREELARIQAAAARIRGDSQVLVVVGIGGSYLGARALLELLRSPHYNLRRKDTPDIFFAGTSLSTDGTLELLELLEGRDFSVNVISKSGTTTEPAVAFRLLRQLLEKRYGRAGAARRIYATTDRSRGALRALADAEGYESFAVPEDIGGRYSVLTAVGLLPLAAAGIDVQALLAGAEEAMEWGAARSMDNPAWQYAAARNVLYEQGKRVELLACYEPGFRFMGEWWKQLYGESEGKSGRGLFPASAEYTADLHSLGQYVQEGERLLLETVVHFDRPRGHLAIPPAPEDGDGLGFLSGRAMDFVAEQAMRGTRLAHVDGGVPNLLLRVPAVSERWIGQLVYLFELACGLSGYVLGVNPFDQPGVEAYKQNMFALLGKPGFEDRRARLEARLSPAAPQGNGENPRIP